ncbi:MAG: peptide deformylase, partial [Deltaproteobacteria bacterium]|nr:peptide deformylase [Deltaproteobacteria bacterium]
MSLLNIVVYPAPILHQVAKMVEKVDAEIHQLLDDMTETMRSAPGVGLAAPQVNIERRVVVIDVTEGKELYQMVNPEIVSREGDIEWEEGCLSIPDFRIVMKRSRKVTCHYLDRNGKEQTINAENLLAVC